MNSSSWWSHKLGGAPAPSRSSAYTPPVVVPPQYATPEPVQQHHQPQESYHVSPGHQRVLDPSRAENEQIGMGEALHLWKGGEAWRVDGGRDCPSCGSHLFFSNNKSRVNGVVPAPRCYSCGYNGKFEQADQGNWI